MSQQLNIFAQQPDDDEDDVFFRRPAEPARPRLAAVQAVLAAPTPAPAANRETRRAAKKEAKRAAKKEAKPVNRYPLPRRNPHRAAQHIAEAVADAWHRNHGGGRMDIPVGLVAALALLPWKGPDAPLLADRVLGLDARDLVGLLRECWAYWWIQRPDLVHRAGPIARWTEEDLSDHHLSCVKAVARAAITNGLLTLTGSSDPGELAECDLMSWTITGLRSHVDRKWLGEYHTPPEICELMARVQLGDPSEVGPDFSVLEPTAGTGGLVRATAQVMREHRLDPGDYRWHLVELDQISAAGAAVNMLLWGMGPRTTVWCGNSLAPVDTAKLAEQEKAEVFEHRERLKMVAAMIAAVSEAERLIAGVYGEKAA
ncbi:N-6 DNA methylase [Kitasatospora cineracea]|uniref:N-6 DNA methylase n=1 Tax=Kitasatospora cineracea TaxID=88074 RepID=UPI0036A79EF7